jgi:uncharacterized membrane protein
LDRTSWIASAATGFELAGVAAMTVGTLVVLGISLVELVRSGWHEHVFTSLRQNVGRSILLGLELLVGADIIRTIAEEPTYHSVGLLGLIVLIRTFLSMSLEVELEGHWPWQRAQRLQEPKV